MARNFGCILVLILLIIGKPCLSQSVTGENYLRYSQIVETIVKRLDLNEGEVIVITESAPTNNLGDALHFSDHDSKKWPADVHAFYKYFKSAASTRIKFEPKFKLPGITVLIRPETEIDSLYRNRYEVGEQDFIARYPKCKAIIHMSRIIYSKNKKFGMVYIDYKEVLSYGKGYLIYFYTGEAGIDMVNKAILLWTS